ncbi:MAG: hypothetical protein ACLQSR_03030 [Limisphaerales bacterium]
MKNHSEKNCDKIARLFLLTPLLVLAAGCHRDSVQVYTVSTDQDQPPPLAQTAPTNMVTSTLPPGHPDISSMPVSGAPAADQSVSPITFTMPPGWTEVPPSEMRVASFKVSGADGKQADVSVVPLPGMAGGDAANVNRWRGQVGLETISDEQIQSAAENIQAAGQAAQLYDIGGATSRILGVIQHRDGNAWFFKMTGDPALVEDQKSNFVAFLTSISFTAGPATAQLPPGHPEIGGMDTVATGPISHEGQPNWQVPVGWTEVSGGQFLVAKFTISGDGGATAAVNVSSSAGDGGGLAANLNRWRGQLGLAPTDDITATALPVAGGQGQLVDLSGTVASTGQPAELVGVMVTQPDKTWFYKLMGDPKVVAAQKQAFTQFVQGVKY